MSARERIMTIRLMKKIQEHPTYAKALGITVNLENKQKSSKEVQ